MISIGINSIIATTGSVKRHRPQDSNLRQFTGKAPSGFLSARTKNRLRSTLENWLETETRFQKSNKNAPINALPTMPRKSGTAAMQPIGAPKKYNGKSRPTFITLTFSEASAEPTPSEKRRTMNAWLTAAKRTGITHIFWVAEKSDAGRLHFHVITESWNDDAAEAWRRITANPSRRAVEERPIRNVKGVVRYVLKGCNHILEGRIWGMSKTVKEFENVKIDGHAEHDFFRENVGQMRFEFGNEFATIYRPTGKLRTRMIRHFSKIRLKQVAVALPTVKPRMSRRKKNLSRIPQMHPCWHSCSDAPPNDYCESCPILNRTETISE